MLLYECIQLTGTGFPQGPSHQDGKKWSHKADELFSLRGPGQLWCIHAVEVCWWCWRWRWGWWRWREPKLVVQELVRLVQFLDFKSKCNESIESMERMEWDLDLEARWMEGATLLCFCFFLNPGEYFAHRVSKAWDAGNETRVCFGDRSTILTKLQLADFPKALADFGDLEWPVVSILLETLSSGIFNLGKRAEGALEDFFWVPRCHFFALAPWIPCKASKEWSSPSMKEPPKWNFPSWLHCISTNMRSTHIASHHWIDSHGLPMHFTSFCFAELGTFSRKQLWFHWVKSARPRFLKIKSRFGCRMIHLSLAWQCTMTRKWLMSMGGIPSFMASHLHINELPNYQRPMPNEGRIPAAPGIYKTPLDKPQHKYE